MTARAELVDPGYLATGDLLKGRYQIVKEIGRGGYSIVYAAIDRQLDSAVAIKLLVPPPAVAQIARERMRREVQVVRGLSHTNIVAVHDFLEEGPWTFVVMEHVAGPDVSVQLAKSGPLATEQVERIAKGVSAALQAAHQRGILHRDIKPSNILLDNDGRPRLTDFGSAKLDGQTSVTQTGGLVGTLPYTAPEILAGQRGDARSDIYSLGMTLYVALTNRLPDAPSPHLPPPPREEGHHPQVIRPDIPDWLDNVVACATAASPGNRFPTASSLSEAFERRDVDELIVSPPASAARPDTCIICGGSEPLGLEVCPRCGGTSSDAADTLIFIRRPIPSEKQHTVSDYLKTLLAGRAEDAAVEAVAAGHRALVRVPSEGAETVVRNLALRKVPAQAVHASRAWAPVPWRFYGMLGFVIGIGGAAGITGLPIMLWMSPLVAGLLVLGAQVRLQRPVVAPLRRVSKLPAELEKKIVETFAQLPVGNARSLLADIICIGQGIHTTLSASETHAGTLEQLTDLIVHSCQAAIDLSDLDESLSRLARHREQLPRLSADWLEGVSRCERTRDALTQQLLEVMSLLGRLRGQTVESSAAREELAELIREVEAQVEAHLLAAREIEQLLDATNVMQESPAA
jgi:hypothetical protein